MNTSPQPRISMSGRRPQPRARAVRLACAMFGIMILGAVTLGTWQAISLDYKRAPLETKLRFRVPAKRVMAPSQTDFLEVPRTRLLIHLVTVEATPSGLNPLEVDQIDMQWPQGHETFRRFLWAGDYQITYTFVIHCAYYSRARTGERTATLKVAGEHRYAITDAHGHRVHADTRVTVITSDGSPAMFPFGNRDIIDVLRIKRNERAAQLVCSTVPRSSRGSIHLLFFATRVTDDDPLKTISWTDFCKQWGEKGKEVIRAEMREPWSGVYSGAIDKHSSLRGLALLSRWGIAGILLLAGAILLTQLFVHRLQAFPIVLAVVVLYSAVLDRALLRAHLSRLNDPHSSPATRMVACDRIGYTFFFRKTAIRHLKALTDDVQTPEELRYLASDAAQWLSYSLPPIVIPSALKPFSHSPQVIPVSSGGGLRAPFTSGPPISLFVPSPNGRLAAVSSDGNPALVELWDVSTRQLKNSFNRSGGRNSSVGSIAFSPDGATLASVNSQRSDHGPRNELVPTLTLTDLRARPPRLIYTQILGPATIGRSIDRVAFSPDGATLATLNGQESNNEPREENEPPEKLLSVLKLWDLHTSAPRLLRTQVLSSSPNGQPINSLAFSADGRKLLCSSESQFELWEISAVRRRTWLPRWSKESYASTDPYCPTLPPPILSPDGKTLAVFSIPRAASNYDLTSGAGGPVELWDIPDKRTSAPWLRCTLATDDTHGVSFSHDSKQVVCTTAVLKQALVIGEFIKMFNVQTGALQWRRLLDTPVSSSNDSNPPPAPSFSPDGKALSVTQEIRDNAGIVVTGNRTELWDTRTGRTLLRVDPAPLELTYQNRLPPSPQVSP